MAEPPVHLTTGLPETVLPAGEEGPTRDLEAARALAGGARRSALARLVAARPTLLEGWAALALCAREPVEAYAYARVGYHRGLDALRAAGWRGSGYVRWRHPSNRGFLSALDALRAAAAAIGEDAEEQRCATFLRQLDPSWPPEDGPPSSGATWSGRAPGGEE